MNIVELIKYIEEKKIQNKIDSIQKKLDKLDEDTISVRNAIIAYAKEKGVTLKFAYASGTRSSVGGIGRINEKGVEMISAPDGNGNYIPKEIDFTAGIVCYKEKSLKAA